MTTQSSKEENMLFKSSMVMSLFRKAIPFTVLSILITTLSASAIQRQSAELKSGGKVIVSGQVEMSDHFLNNRARGFVRIAPGRRCGEVWFDWTTRPHKHYDALVVRTCSSSGWGKWHHRDGVSNIPINGVRMAVCEVRTRGSRTCSADWVYDSIRAGTYSVENL
jgi:hypothetical protein